MSAAILLKQRASRKILRLVQGIGIAMMFLGIALQLTDYSGHTFCYVTGAMLILFVRVNLLWLTRARKES
jgi:hypothetical protein